MADLLIFFQILNAEATKPSSIPAEPPTRRASDDAHRGGRGRRLASKTSHA